MIGSLANVIKNTLSGVLTLYHPIQTFETLVKMPFENIVGKGENAGNQHFLLFPQRFLPFFDTNLIQLSKTEIIILATLNLSSAKFHAFSLVEAKILSFGKGLNIIINQHFFSFPTKFSIPSKTEIITLPTLNLSSANAFSLVEAKFCPLVKG